MTSDSDSAPATVTGASGLIDVHSHFPAPALRRAWERAGGGTVGGALPVWNAEETLDVLGDVGIEYAVLSPIPPPVNVGLHEARRTTRDFNEELADQIADDPGTFGGVALLPLPHVDTALEELAYALDVLKLEGAHLFAVQEGIRPGVRDLAPLLEELNRRRVTVMTHATAPEDVARSFLAATTRMAADLVRSGALDRYPDIRWILPHGGATVAPANHRPNGSASAAPSAVAPGGAGRGRPASGLHVDVVCHAAEPELGDLVRRHGPDRLLFGSGMPVESAAHVAHDITTLMGNIALGEAGTRAVARDNALRLFPSAAAKLRRGAPGPAGYCP